MKIGNTGFLLGELVVLIGCTLPDIVKFPYFDFGRKLSYVNLGFGMGLVFFITVCYYLMIPLLINESFFIAVNGDYVFLT